MTSRFLVIYATKMWFDFVIKTAAEMRKLNLLSASEKQLADHLMYANAIPGLLVKCCFYFSINGYLLKFKFI